MTAGNVARVQGQLSLAKASVPMALRQSLMNNCFDGQNSLLRLKFEEMGSNAVAETCCQLLNSKICDSITVTGTSGLEREYRENQWLILSRLIEDMRFPSRHPAVARLYSWRSRYGEARAIPRPSPTPPLLLDLMHDCPPVAGASPLASQTPYPGK